MSAPVPMRRVPWTALIGALLLLFAGFAMALFEEHLHQGQRLHEASEEADILAASETAALSFRDSHAAGEYVRSVQVNPEIEAVGVYASDGTRLAGFVRDGSAPLPARVTQAQAPHFDHDRVVDVVPVREQATPLGMVYLRATAERQVTRLLREGVLGLLVAMGMIVITGLGSAQLRLQRQALRLADANARLQTEIVERGKAEEALRQSQKMEAIGQLSGAIAHDFNNLMMIVRGNLHLLQKKQAVPADDRHLRAAMEGITRAAALTQRILAFSRKQDLTPTTLQVSELILGMDDLIRNSLRENIEIVRELRARGWVVLDRNQMENVILNLVINARDAMPTGGRLLLRTEDIDIVAPRREFPDAPAGPYVAITLRDTGAGMSEEVRAKALDPFFTTKPAGQGTGLGLSTSFGFISQSGGTLAIQSAPGKGTTIAILLPRVPAHAAAPA